jgi:hypothetical protein
MKKNNDNETKNTEKSAKKDSSVLNSPATSGERATDRVKPASTDDVNGASGLRNTGTNVSYEGNE